MRDGAQLVQLRVHAGGDHIAPAQLGGVFRERRGDAGEQLVGIAHGADELVERGTAGAAAEFPDGVHPPQRAPQLADFPRKDFARGGAGNDALQVAHLAQVAPQFLEHLFVVMQELHHIVTGLQLLDIHYRHRQPLAQQAGAHRGAAAVDHIDQRHPLAPGVALEDLEVAEGELVHPDELLLVDAADRADVAQTRMLGLLQVDQQRAG